MTTTQTLPSVLVPGDDKIPVTLTIERQGRTTDLWVRWIDPDEYDPEHRQASTLAAEALRDSADVELRRFWTTAGDEPADAEATVQVGGRVLYAAVDARDLLGVLEQFGTGDQRPAWDWPIEEGF